MSMEKMGGFTPESKQEKLDVRAEVNKWGDFYKENFPNVEMPEITQEAIKEIEAAIEEGLKDLVVVPKGLDIEELTKRFKDIWIAELGQKLLESKGLTKEAYVAMSKELEDSANRTSQDIEKILASKGLRGESVEEYLLRQSVTKEEERDNDYSYTFPASNIQGRNLAGSWSPAYRSYQINAIDPSFRSAYLKARAVKEIKL